MQLILRSWRKWVTRAWRMPLSLLVMTIYSRCWSVNSWLQVVVDDLLQGIIFATLHYILVFLWCSKLPPMNLSQCQHVYYCDILFWHLFLLWILVSVKSCSLDVKQQSLYLVYNDNNHIFCGKLYFILKNHTIFFIVHYFVSCMLT